MGSPEPLSQCTTVKLKSAPVAGLTGAGGPVTRPTGKQRAHLKQTFSHGQGCLPEGLVGTRCTAEVLIAGEECSCLLDTGSQVTTVAQSFYKQKLTSQILYPLDDLLEVEGANGQTVPYTGYIEISITFPKSFLGVDIEVPTLALVVPDCRAMAMSPVLVGTNTLDVLYDKYSEMDATRHQPYPYGYRAVLKTLAVRQKQRKDGNLGLVRLQGGSPEVIPAGQRVVMEGVVNTHSVPAEKWAVMEPPSTYSLPGGILVTCSLLTLPTRAPYRLPVVLTNETQHDILLPQRSVLAELNAIQEVLPTECKTKDPSPDPPKPPPASTPSINFADSPIPTEWKERIEQELRNMPDVFSQHDLDYGKTGKVKHHISLHDETPFKQRARPIHPQDIQAVRKHLHELLDAGIIRESESSFSSPIVVVRKKNGDVRLCIDYRKLNTQTVKDAYALPNLEETFTALHGSKWFSVLDLKSGYYQIEMEEEDKPKTAFVCPLGFWEFQRMPQGITNAPSTFQRLMEKCMGDMNLKEAIVFLDDIIIFSETLEEHERRLLRVLDRLREYGLKLSVDKCKFFQTSVKYLGHIVSRNGVETDPEKTSALKTWPSPTNLKELRSFLGFSGYYRRFIQGYSKIVKPLTDLTVGYPPLRKTKRPKEKNETYYHPKEPFKDRWTAACQSAFDEVVDRLTTAPVLGFANPTLPYILHTDASTTGLGAALYQEQDGLVRPIAFASRGLSHSEARYPAHKLEFLALKWSVTEKFSDYLYGNQFTVITDSNPLTYILTSAKLDATSYRWLSALSTFSFTLQYRAGKHNMDADGLSRRPHGDLVNDLASQKERERIQQFASRHSLDNKNLIQVEPEVIQAVCGCHLLRHEPESESHEPCIALVESLAMHADAIPDIFEGEDNVEGTPTVKHLSSAELKEKQRADFSIREVILQLETGQKPPPTLRQELPELPLLLREWPRLEIKEGVLYRKRKEMGRTTFQLVLPKELRATAMKSLHDDMGHLGIERTTDLLRSRFYWPKMAAEVETKVKTCDRCIRRKAPPQRAAPLVNIQVTRPLELVCMDFLSIEPDSSNTTNILVITDHYTKYAVAVPTPNQKARTVAKCLWENFIIHYGIPERLHSDQGPDFESKTIKELCEVTGIRKVRTTPYHPRGNPVERFNRTLLSMLGTLKDQDKAHWRDFVRPLVHAYNCTKSEVTGYSPYELMFGRQPRLPIDLAFGVPLREHPQTSHSDYVRNLKSHLEESYKLATSNAAKIAARNKARFDGRVTESALQVGDRVLVRSVRLRGKHKLADKWEHEIHVVTKQAGDLPVYTVKPENQDGPLRTLHRDLLLPCGFLPAPEDPPTLPVSVPCNRPRRSARLNPVTQDVDGDANHESDDDITVYQDANPVCVESNWHTYQTELNSGSSMLEDRQLRDYNYSNSSSHETNLPGTGTGTETEKDDLPGTGAETEKGNLPGTGTETEKGDLPGTGTETERETLLDTEPEGESLSDEELGQQHSVGRLPKFPDNTPNIMDETLPVLSDLSDSDEESLETETEAPMTGAVVNEDGKDTTHRHSNRKKVPPKRFHYPQLGNPLVSIVQSLFQGLSLAFTDMLQGTNYNEAGPNGPHPVITGQRCRCNGTYTSLRGECVTPGY